MSSRKTLDMVCDGECDPAKYCILKEMALSSFDDRTMSQIKILEVHKYLMSRKDNREYTWKEASMHYVDNGFAKAFAKVYRPEQPEVSAIELYKGIEKILEEEKNGPRRD